jgi:ABC-type multidrug transport system fused ATPase/permease subunit
MTIAFIEERIAGTEDLRGNGGLPFTLGQMRTLTTADGNARRKANTVARVTQGSWELLLAGGLALAFTLGALFITAGTMTLGALYLVFAYTSLISANLMQITEQLDDFQRASANIERTAELLNTRSRIADGPRSLPAGALAVAFESVGFEYAGDTPVLRDVTFRLEAGRKLGLLGRTGSGKTTIARLLSRFYDPVAGRVTLGGMDLREAQVPSVRARVSVVTQEVQLFHGTVRDNLTFWDNAAQGGRIGDEQIRKALASLGLGAWLGRLSNGLDTAIAGSSSLSAGEAQLLALGRAFLQNPGLVILDEASARLDPTTERMIEIAIERLLAGRTAIIIAHRLSTAMKADDILVLERGRVVEHGPRLTLQHDPASRFAAMLRTGLIEEDEA